VLEIARRAGHESLGTLDLRRMCDNGALRVTREPPNGNDRSVGANGPLFLDNRVFKLH
jgi:hypothetical protein